MASLEGWSSTTELHPRLSAIVNGWSGWSDSNRRPRAPKARALTKLRYSPNDERVLPARFLSQAIRMFGSWNSDLKSLSG